MRLKKISANSEIFVFIVAHTEIFVFIVDTVKREKGRDLTQSYDKSPYTQKNPKTKMKNPFWNSFFKTNFYFVNLAL